MLPDALPRAPAAREKLARAEAVFAGLDADVDALALDFSEGKPGADKALAAHRSKIELAVQSVSDQRRAVALAERLDRQAEIAARSKIRQQQLSVIVGLERAREGTVTDICDGIEKLAGAFDRYVNLTARAVGSVPVGTSLPAMAMGPSGILGNVFGDLGQLIRSEAFRRVNMASTIRAKLPFASAPTMGLSDNPGAIPSGLEAFREASAAIIAELRAQVAKCDAADAAALAPRSAAVSEEAA